MTSLKITEQKCWEIYWDIEVFKNSKDATSINTNYDIFV